MSSNGQSDSTPVVGRRSSKVAIFGLALNKLTMAQTLGMVENYISSGEAVCHLTADLTKAVRAARDRAFADLINRATLVSTDGMSIVWAFWLLQREAVERVTGVDLCERLLSMASDRGWSVYFLGAKEPVVRTLVAVVQKRFPTLKIVGACNGYWRPEEDEFVINTVIAAAPHILFVGVSSPKAERFLAKWQCAPGARYSISVGGSFDVIAGIVSRAPRWMQRTGLEWFWRLLQEPKRLTKRYFFSAIYLPRLFLQELTHRGK
jgi:N-acetylglucosaminyldiphosphoundecaprenol N-acetyl-beta-D-mannosaminyltransferase